MQQSNSSKIYAAYLAEWNEKNPNVVKPIYVSMFTPEDKELSLAQDGQVDTNTQGKCLRPSNVFVLLDGRTVEAGVDGRGNHLYAVFPSLEAAQNYKEPTSYNEYFGRW